MQVRTTFHATCRAIILSNADDHTKALAQVGLGTWDMILIADLASTLLLNLNSNTGQIVRVLRRVVRKVAN